MNSSIKNKSRPSSFSFLRILQYFPVRFMLCGFFFSYLLLSNSQLLVFESNILVHILNFFQFPSYLDGVIFVGGVNNPVEFIPPINTQTFFLVFFLSFAVSTSSTIKSRLKILFFGGLYILALILTQFLTIVVLFSLGLSSQVTSTQANIIITAITSSVIIETCLLYTMKLPRRTKVNTIIKRSYIEEWIYLIVSLCGSILLVYTITSVFKIQVDSLVSTYLAISIFTILSFRYFISYFIFETKIPYWVRHAAMYKTDKNNFAPISFLLPAFNEEKHIKRCIESIDLAASRYFGKTEIIVVNDGSTDKTREIASSAVLNLKCASGKVYNISNSGKGFALQYGLKQTSGDIIFRIDSDSAIDREAITPIMNHFQDPTVGSVSGLILPLEEKNWMQKVWILQLYLLVFYRREWELIDSVLSQPGAFSVFRKDALVKVGGWVDHQLGEDGEITVRLGRCGYRNTYEPRSISYSDVPSNLKDLREQRVRWCIAFYHARAANLNVVGEFKSPISFMYGLALVRQVSVLAGGLFIPFMLAQIVIGNSLSIYNIASIFGISLGLVTIEILTYGLQGIVNTYFLLRSNRLDLIKYLPFLRLYDMIHSMFFEPEAAEILLSVSSRWSEHNKELSQALRKKIRHGI